MTKITCPRCDSPSPELHPATQFEGEVQICLDSFHKGKCNCGSDDTTSTRHGHSQWCDIIRLRLFRD